MATSLEKETRTEALKPKQQQQKRDVMVTDAKSQEAQENGTASVNSTVGQHENNTAVLSRTQHRGTAGVDSTIRTATANSTPKISSTNKTTSAVTDNKDTAIGEEPKASSGAAKTSTSEKGVLRTETIKNSENSSEKMQKEKHTGKHVTFLEEKNVGRGTDDDLQPELDRPEAQDSVPHISEVQKKIASQKGPGVFNDSFKTPSQRSGKEEKTDLKPQDGRATLQSRENAENSSTERRVEEGNERADGKRDVSRSNPVIVEIRGEKRGRSDSVDTKPGKRSKTHKQKTKGGRHGKLKFPANLDVDSFLSKIHNGS
ncbi:PREDICTED: uncharacterized protein LOC109476763 [Branchiostoma belcheri]|uniref:Uncharacterized protein LOC109476763 n=1 Tax=Branchiostoma belcheri TaxID=7741 RepID=A0A6P4ZUR9_BRABE|nr:PREDICTED: uncharacterized protein LOC109476763 [Branchiostoma belcheri]